MESEMPKWKESPCHRNMNKASNGEEKEEKTKLRSQGEFDDDCSYSRSSDSFLPGLFDDIALTCLARACRSDYSSLRCLNVRFNSLIKSGYLYELRWQLGIVEHWVYMLCYLKEWEAFDPFRKKWMKLPKIPSNDLFHYSGKESLAVGSELLVFGRELYEFAIWKYSLTSRNWVKGEGMNRPRCLFASGSLGPIAIVSGGTDRNGNVLKSAELYDSLLGTWEMLPSMHSPRRLCSGFFMDGKFYVIGGMTNSTDALSCGEEFDLKTRKWRKIEGMYPNVNTIGQAPPLVAVVNNQLYAVEYFTNMVKKYNKENNTWDVLGRLPVRADSLNGWGLAFKSFGDELLVVSGGRGPEGEAVVLNSWNPKSGFENGTLDWKVLAIVSNPISLPDKMNPLLKDLLEGLLCKDPGQRMTLDDIAKHPWVVGEDGPIQQYVCWCKRNQQQREAQVGSRSDTLS